MYATFNLIISDLIEIREIDIWDIEIWEIEVREIKVWETEVREIELICNRLAVENGPPETLQIPFPL